MNASIRRASGGAGRDGRCDALDEMLPQTSDPSILLLRLNRRGLGSLSACADALGKDCFYFFDHSRSLIRQGLWNESFADRKNPAENAVSNVIAPPIPGAQVDLKEHLSRARSL